MFSEKDLKLALSLLMNTSMVVFIIMLFVTLSNLTPVKLFITLVSFLVWRGCLYLRRELDVE